MKNGDIVYTVNNKTNEVDEWIYAGSFRTNNELLIHLTHGKKYAFLPARCVFTTREEALKIAESK